MTSISQRDAIAEPHDQLGSDPAAHRRQHRPGYGIHLRQEPGQLHLAGMPRPLPASHLWLDALPHNAYRAAVDHCHVNHRRALLHLVATGRYLQQVARSQWLRMFGRSTATGWTAMHAAPRQCRGS
jgi:hypothetical protein